MAARYATDTFSVQLATGSHLVVEGSLRDSAHPAVTAAPAPFSGAPPVLKTGHMAHRLFYLLPSDPKGPGGGAWPRGRARSVRSWMTWRGWGRKSRCGG